MTTGSDNRGRPDGLAKLLRMWRKRALLTQEQLADFEQLDHPDAANVHSRLSEPDPDGAPEPGPPTAHRQ